MSPAESDMLKSFIESQSMVNRELLNDIGEIRRGLYGDSKNKVKGLIQRQEEDEAEIEKLKAFKTKMNILWGMIVTGSLVIWESIKTLFIK